MTQPALSILDLVPVSEGMSQREALENSLALAQLADRSQYTRYWVAEHHNTETFISSATELLIALAAERTQRIRVGSGGIMLPNHSPLKVAENFLTLAALYPDRIDLGLGRAPGTDRRTALALRRSPEALAADDFPHQIAQLQAFAGEREWPEGSVFSSVRAHPTAALPPLYILGSSLYGAQLAGQLGRPYAFAYHFSDLDPAEALGTYRAHFQPSEYLEEPYAMMGVNALAAATEEEAQYLSRTGAALALSIGTGRRGPLMSPDRAAAWLGEMGFDVSRMSKKMVVGEPAQVVARLHELAERAGAQELLLTTHVYDPTKRLESYRLIAEAADLGREAAPNR